MLISDEITKIKKEYYDLKDNENLTNEAYEMLRTKFNNVNFQVPELKYTGIDLAKTFAFICPDTEWEFPYVILIQDDGFETNKKYMGLVYDAISEYYSNSSFYDEITCFGVTELINMTIMRDGIPVVFMYETPKSEVLNIRRLRNESE